MKGQRLRERCAVLCLAIFGAAACVEETTGPTDTVLAISDNQADFGAYETFMLAELPEDADDPPVDLPAGDLATLENAIVDEMTALGMTQVEVEEDADLLVGSFVKVKTVEAETTGYWYEYYWGWYWGYWEYWYDEEIVEFDMGTLVVDAVDVKNTTDDEDGRLVFRGAAFGLINDDTSSDRTQRIRNAVGDIFEKWPEGSEQ